MTYQTDLELFIDGSWRSGEGRDTHTLLNPASAEAIAHVPYATAADLDEASAPRSGHGPNGAQWTSRSAAQSSTRWPSWCASVPTIPPPP